MEKLLAIETPVVQTFLHHAHQIAILQNEDTFKGWFYTNYMQLYTYFNRKNPLDDYYVDFFSCNAKYPINPFLRCFTLDRDIVAFMETDSVQFIIQSIDNDYYVDACIDEYYWQNKRAYLSIHFIHNNLIFGYSKTNQCFYYLGYDKNMIFGKYSVSFENFTESFIQNETTDLKLIKNATKELIDYSNRYVSHDNINFDIELFTKYLEDYIHSKNSFLSHKGSENSVFGSNVYNDIIEKFTSNLKVAKDMRIFRLLWEHKVVMLDRIVYLINIKLLTDNNALFEEFALLEKRFHVLKNLAMKFLVSENYSILVKIIKEITELSIYEKKLLQNLLNTF